MFEISTKKVDFGKENTVIKRSINLDKKLDCFILISSKDANLWELILKWEMISSNCPSHTIP